MLSIHWFYTRSRYSVIKRLEVDIIVTSHTTSTFNMADVNKQERESLMATPMLKSTLEFKRYVRKRIYHGCLVQIEKSVPWDHCLASLSTALWCQTLILWQIFLSTPHTHERFLYSAISGWQKGDYENTPHHYWTIYFPKASTSLEVMTLWTKI